MQKNKNIICDKIRTIYPINKARIYYTSSTIIAVDFYKFYRMYIFLEEDVNIRILLSKKEDLPGKVFYGEIDNIEELINEVDKYLLSIMSERQKIYLGIEEGELNIKTPKLEVKNYNLDHKAYSYIIEKVTNIIGYYFDFKNMEIISQDDKLLRLKFNINDNFFVTLVYAIELRYKFWNLGYILETKYMESPLYQYLPVGEFDSMNTDINSLIEETELVHKIYCMIYDVPEFPKKNKLKRLFLKYKIAKE